VAAVGWDSTTGLGNRSFAHLLIAHFLSFQKSNWAIAHSFALLKRANEQSLFSLLFAKGRIALFSALFKRANERSLFFCSIKKSNKRAIAILLFQKEQRKERLLFLKERKSKNEQKMSNFPICSFLAKKKEHIDHFQNKQMANPDCRVRQSLICSFVYRSFPLLSKKQLSDRSFCCSLQKSKWGIALFSLFSKERQKERSLFCSFKKSERAKMSDRSFSKWANAQPCHILMEFL